MNCPYCSSPDSRVVDSRETESKEAIRRRRECSSCGQRFTTYEKIEEIPITVVKRDGSTELFHPEKLLQGSHAGLHQAARAGGAPPGRGG